AGETIEFAATVIGLPEQRGGRARIEVRPDRTARADGVPPRVLLGWFRPLEWFRPGETWRFSVRLEPPSGRYNPGLFDYHRYLVARGIGGDGRIVAAQRIAPADARSAPDRFRQRFADWLQAETVSLEAAALHRALTVADRSAMTPELSGQLRRTGTAHLLAISGLHVGMVAALAGLLAGLLVTPFLATGVVADWIPDRRRVMLWAGLLAAAGYALLAGFTLPTRRALVMLVVGFGALLWRRPIRPGHALIMALAAVLLLDPRAPLATGFWLSFAAVAVLIWAFAGRSSGPPSRFGWLSGLVRAQLVIAIGMLPLNIGVFQQWAPTALAANLVAIPLVGLWVLPGLLLALVLFAFGLPASWAVSLSEAGMRALLVVLQGLAEFDSRMLAVGLASGPAPGLAAMLLAAFGTLWLLAPRGWPLKMFGALLLLPLLWPAGQRPGSGEFDVMVPDLGDGRAVIVTTRNHVLLYGTGPGDGAASSLVAGTLEPLVRQAGRRHVDVVVLPDDHRDWAGGRAEARRVWPDAAWRHPQGVDGERCVAGVDWTLDEVEFRVLHPSPALPDLGRDSGCVIEIRSPAGSVLLTPEVGSAVMRRLVLEDRLRPVDVLLLPRAGHRQTVVADAFDRLAPATAVAMTSETGAGARPHPETLRALSEGGTEVLSTGACGALTFRFRHDRQPLVRAELTARSRFWNRGHECRP
ncbi:MAG: DNA internalization-related competence protein ComEC/Rec2, partial [Wenzhouxiangellaceae bacterium]